MAKDKTKTHIGQNPTRNIDEYPEVMYNHKVVYFDVDDTLVVHDLSSYEGERILELDYGIEPITVGVNQKNVNTLIWCAKLGYSIVVWSKTGGDWAYEVVRALRLSKYVRFCLTKPNFIVDDRPATDWIGNNLWRAPK